MAEKKNPLSPSLVVFAAVGLIFLLVYFISPDRLGMGVVYPVSYTQFKHYLEQGKVARVRFDGDNITGELREPITMGAYGEYGQRFHAAVPMVGDPALLALLEDRGVEVDVVSTTRVSASGTLLAWVPWFIIIGIWIWFMRRAFRNVAGGLGGRGGDLRQFLDPEKQATVPKARFSDMAGQENAKREVTELVDFLRDPQRFTKLGAEVPHGVLLMGPPGTGKTLLARALAGEAGVPFYSISASEFIEVFVGVGASRVRNLFNAAKQKAPSIIFIDELDSVGRVRGTGLGGGHDEREQTLNQILAEMDGFSGHEAVIVLAATNRPDVLDPALLRPGRFDRHVTLDLPDLSDRKLILLVHVRGVPLADDVNLDSIAAGTPGFSGADLKNLVNEATFFAARAKSDKVTMAYFDEARDKLLLGTVRTLAIQPEEKHRLAVHEAGHTAAAYYLPSADPLYKVTIIPRGRALGGTHQLPEKERHTLPEDYLRNRLVVILAGRSAEKNIIGTVSSGADDDIRQATSLARAMVTRWGMSDNIGPMDLRDSDEHPFLGREIAQPRHFSESSAQRVDETVREILKDAEDAALAIIVRHREKIIELIAALEKNETLFKDQIEQILREDRSVETPGVRLVSK